MKKYKVRLVGEIRELYETFVIVEAESPEAAEGAALRVAEADEIADDCWQLCACDSEWITADTIDETP